MTTHEPGEPQASEAVQQKIAEYVRNGYEVTTQLPNGTQLKKGKDLVFVELDKNGDAKVYNVPRKLDRGIS